MHMSNVYLPDDQSEKLFNDCFIACHSSNRRIATRSDGCAVRPGSVPNASDASIQQRQRWSVQRCQTSVECSAWRSEYIHTFVGFTESETIACTKHFHIIDYANLSKR